MLFFLKLGIQTGLEAGTRLVSSICRAQAAMWGQLWWSLCVRMGQLRKANAQWRCETTRWGLPAVLGCCLLTGLAPLSAPGSRESPLCLCDLSFLTQTLRVQEGTLCNQMVSVTHPAPAPICDLEESGYLIT